MFSVSGRKAATNPKGAHMYGIGTITHEVRGGFCIQCGDTEEWLRSAGENVVDAPADEVTPQTTKAVGPETPAGTPVVLGARMGTIAGTLTGEQRWRNHQLYFQYATPQGSTRWAAFLLVA